MSSSYVVKHLMLAIINLKFAFRITPLSGGDFYNSE